MARYDSMNAAELKDLLASLRGEYKNAQEKNLNLDLSRGKPGADQLDLSTDIMDAKYTENPFDAAGNDCRNYGVLEGIAEARTLMGNILGVKPEQVLIGGSSSLNLMHDCMSIAYIHGLVDSKTPWGKLDEVKIICPSPGYDRHFAVAEHFGFTLVTVPMTMEGPDMDVVEQLVQSDASVKAMWCIPKYQNPMGITFSDDVVRRIANLKPAAEDFCVFWDNAYAVHDLNAEKSDKLLNLMDELEKSGKPNMAIHFTSTSKVTFPGAGISALASSTEQINYFKKHWSLQTICYDKLNQLRHVRYFKDIDAVRAHMEKHAALIRPKFEIILTTLEKELGGTGIAEWTNPNGGYFVSLNTPQGCALRTVALCKEAGVVMTSAGATFPYGKEPADRNIRIAPTYATLDELSQAAELFCLCVKIAAVEKLLEKAV